MKILDMFRSLLKPWHNWDDPEYLSGGKVSGIDLHLLCLELETGRTLAW